MPTLYCELRSSALIAFSGADATSFLQAQLTSDVAGLPPEGAQYAGYCSPKGRLLATVLVWRRPGDFLLQLPASLREPIQSRIARYVLRSRVSVSDATAGHVLLGIAGRDAGAIVTAIAGGVPGEPHAVVAREGVWVTRLPIERYVVLANAAIGEDLKTKIAAGAEARSEEHWAALDIEAGVATITPPTHEQYVPQMVNLDLIGGVSYAKGCYPGQEIVARTHYLGRLKQRMFRVRLPGPASPAIGDRLYSADFGAEQSSGGIVNVAPRADAGHEALAVIQTSSAATTTIHWKSLDGPALELLPLPYSLDA